MSGALDDFWASSRLSPDEFQVDAAQAIDDDTSVVVTAPTGSGKTLVAEVAIHLALANGKRSFYTTPIKALSNQKFSDLVEIYGTDRVGLLTGDNVVNGDAEIVVMTTEVLRNMIYAEPGRLENVSIVVLDEVHYLQDRSRGAVWEEVIIHCPRHVLFVCLSATVSNNREFAEWVGQRRGPTRLVATEHRPVPLDSMYMIKDKMGSQALHLLPTFVRRDGRTRPNPKIEHMLGLERGRRRRFKTPNRADVVERLDEEGMLPAIYFIFSRAGCDAAAHRLLNSGVRLTDAEERETIRKTAEELTDHLSDGDLGVLGYAEWVSALEAGIGAHHAGLVPAFKETVEALFEAGLLKVVFATETLALGINMPARSVVIENLSKFNGETHELLRPGDYTQLTGRAGRRGIDKQGYGIVLHSPFVGFDQVTGIAAVGSHPLKSSFRPTYNMTANLIANYDRTEAEEILEASFASFQREGDRHAAETTIAAVEAELAKEEARASCERGSVEEYLALVESTSRGSRHDGIASTLRSGLVVDVSGGPRDGRYVVLKRLARKGTGARYLVIGTSGRVSTLNYREILDGSSVAGEIELPVPMKPKDRRFSQETMRRLRKIPPRESTRRKSDSQRIIHPVAECPDAREHLAAAGKAVRTRSRLQQLLAARRESGHGLVDEFFAIRDLLEELDYVHDWVLSPRGERLREVYNDSDLLLAEALERGLFYGLDPAEMTALASSFVYEPRTDAVSPSDWPTVELDVRWSQLELLWKDLTERERDHRLSPSRRPDPGFARLAYSWASGLEFDELADRGMAPGDFVRVSRQLVDLLRQLLGSPGIEEEARMALRGVDRGVVAAEGVA